MYKMPQDTKDKYFLTKGGYVIKFVENNYGHIDWCPLKNSSGKTAKEERGGLDLKGWWWHGDGTIKLNPNHNETLEIVSEFPADLVPVLPTGFKFKGGFPKLETVPPVGDLYWAINSEKVFAHIDDNEFVDHPIVGRKRFLVEKETEPAKPTSNVKLEVGKIYITHDGRVVKITSKLSVFADKFVGQIGVSTYHWYENGSRTSTYELESLTIVGECPEKLIPPENPPEGYKWLGGHPKFAKTKNGDLYLNIYGECSEEYTEEMPFTDYSMVGNRRILLQKVEEEVVKLKIEPNKVYLTKGGWLVRTSQCGSYVMAKTSPGKTLGINPMSGSELAAQMYRKDGTGWCIDKSKNGKPPNVDIADELEIVSEYKDMLNPEFPDPPKGYKWKHGFPKLTEVGSGELYMNELATGNVASGWADSSKSWLCLVTSKPEATKSVTTGSMYEPPFKMKTGMYYPDFESKTSVAQSYIETSKLCSAPSSSSGDAQKEEVMKSETAVNVAKATASYAFKVANYCVFETATIWAKKVGNSMRHVAFAGMLFGGFCAYMNPQKTKDVVFSCLPKISFSVSAPDIMK